MRLGALKFYCFDVSLDSRIWKLRMLKRGENLRNLIVLLDNLNVRFDIHLLVLDTRDVIKESCVL